jgi:hypothetical protein
MLIYAVEKASLSNKKEKQKRLPAWLALLASGLATGKLTVAGLKWAAGPWLLRRL